MSAGRPREKILENLESVYRDAYDRAKTAGDERRMADLDAAYQREQLLLEVLLDIRDNLTSKAHLPAGSAPPSGPDPITTLETIRRISQLR